MNSDNSDTNETTTTQQKLRALSTLRNATAPRDAKLERTITLTREERLGEPLPALPPDLHQTPNSTFPAVAASTEPHPWHRYFARLIDFLVILLILYATPLVIALSYGAMRMEKAQAVGGLWLTVLVCSIFALIYEPAMLCMFGSTIGKALFKIRIVDQRTGENLTFWRAVLRWWMVAWYSGNLLQIIPIVGFIAPVVGHIMQYKKLTADKITSYDERLRVRCEHGS